MVALSQGTGRPALPSILTTAGRRLRSGFSRGSSKTNPPHNRTSPSPSTGNGCRSPFPFRGEGRGGGAAKNGSGSPSPFTREGRGGVLQSKTICHQEPDAPPGCHPASSPEPADRSGPGG